MTENCKYCGAKLGKSRLDKTYCNHPTCRAKYHQDVGRGYRGDVVYHLVHKELAHEHEHKCLCCGQQFEVNDYAERGGKREPMYCSAKCKQKAYRDRKR